MKLLTALFLLFSAKILLAQAVSTATPEELIEKLSTPYSTSRSLTARNLAPQAKSVDLVIQFEFDSAKLKNESKPLLDSLASALKSDRLKDMPFIVEGHTDAKGTESYNQNLSLKRANSVVEYMVQQGVEIDRLKPQGKGFSELLMPDRPYAMENRRVRITSQPQ
jgi:outer membrane protein OmpA-like peptidoglycan-associated protein